MSKRTPATDKGTADRIEADDGGYWVRLMTRQALDREGACMDHCVGEGGYDKLVGGEDLVDDAIWSLRDRDGVSILTVRISLGEVDYAKGPSNHEPGRGASMQVRHLVAAFEAAGHPLDVCRGTGIVLLEDGRTFRHDRLPPEVKAEMDEQAASRRLPRFPSVHGMRNGRIEGGYLVVDMEGGTRQLVEVASYFANTPEPVSDGPVDGFDLNDDTVTIRVPSGRTIHVLVAGDTTPVSVDAGYAPLAPSQYEVGPATVLFRPADAPHGTPFREIGQIGLPWEDVVAQQAAERAEYERLGITAPPSQPFTLGVDTQPFEGDLGPSHDMAYRVPEIGPARFAAYVEHTLRSVAACVDLPYEEFTRDWRGVSEASERAHRGEDLRERIARAVSERLHTATGLSVSVCGGDTHWRGASSFLSSLSPLRNRGSENPRT